MRKLLSIGVLAAAVAVLPGPIAAREITRGGALDLGRLDAQRGSERRAGMRDAMRDVTNPSDHPIVTQAGSMIVLTGADGRTTRLSPPSSWKAGARISRAR